MPPTVHWGSVVSPWEYRGFITGTSLAFPPYPPALLLFLVLSAVTACAPLCLPLMRTGQMQGAFHFLGVVHYCTVLALSP